MSHSVTSTIASTSTGISKGSSATPIAERAWRPGVAPELEHEVAEAVDDAGHPLKPGAQLTSPSSFTQPGHAVEVAELALERVNTESAVSRAAS